MDTEAAQDKLMRLRYAGTCRLCAEELPAKTEAIWERATKTVRCVACGPSATEPPDSAVVAEPEPVDSGTAGASARREYERRKAKRDDATRAKHPKLGGLIVALRDDPQSTKSWDTGAKGEERFGGAIDKRVGERLRVLHDRRIPGTRANIDHIVVVSSGVWVVDPKRYVDKRPELKVEGGILRPRVEKLVVGGRDSTKLVQGVLKQVDLVRSAVGPEVPVRGVLCFIEADWPLFGGDFMISGIDVMWPKKLYPLLEADGPVNPDSIESLHRSLATAFPPA
ncbi:hypothetical protein AFL01nite_18030 [Aeromicrobium flavum]|uniref:NERD domain-containing protein n=1 Tax=Aeromicrobium flavum TaxID=416568 RepID=A0A512HVJ7_9ACTN|nr:NERD domain-containing protein [Aeromicrobium flavum]GEO89476.1 hypothetical protein AFL01nite_18030 [Aeromicrobium flavum]